MLAKLKLVAYVILLPLVIWYAWGFNAHYSFVMDSEGDDTKLPRALSDPITQETNALANPISASSEATNSSAAANGEELTNNAVITPVTNSVAVRKPSGKTKHTQKLFRDRVKLSVEQQEAELQQEKGAMARCLVGLVLTAVFLGGLAAYDVTAHFTNKGLNMAFDDDHASGKDPEYERAEQVWADGHPMEAIELMREYLKKNPREQYVALRIAEIYEKDFKNFLAAALEYEEVLKCKLPPERWAWSAIHLCNLYTKLGRDKDHNKLLERIVTDYSKTSAAKKARSRLGLPEPEESVETETNEEQPEPEAKVLPPEPPSNLPSGFRPKK